MLTVVRRLDTKYILNIWELYPIYNRYYGARWREKARRLVDCLAEVGSAVWVDPGRWFRYFGRLNPEIDRLSRLFPNTLGDVEPMYNYPCIVLARLLYYLGTGKPMEASITSSVGWDAVVRDGIFVFGGTSVVEPTPRLLDLLLEGMNVVRLLMCYFRGLRINEVDTLVSHIALHLSDAWGVRELLRALR